MRKPIRVIGSVENVRIMEADELDLDALERDGQRTDYESLSLYRSIWVDACARAFGSYEAVVELLDLLLFECGVEIRTISKDPRQIALIKSGIVWQGLGGLDQVDAVDESCGEEPSQMNAVSGGGSF